MFTCSVARCRELMLAVVMAVAASAAPLPAAAPPIEPDRPARGFFSLRPAPRWEEALLIGNGKMGGLVMGRPFDETIVLTHERLFLPDYPARPPADTSRILPQVRRLIRAGQYRQAAQLAWQTTVEQGYPDRLVWTDPFFPACDLRLELEGAGRPTGYRRSLDYTTGLSRVQWTDAGTLYQQWAFISRADNVLVLQLAAQGAGRLNGRVRLVQHPLDGPGRQRVAQCVAGTDVTAEGPWLTYRCAYKLTGGGYEAVAHVQAEGGTVAGADGAVRVQGARRVMVVLRIQPLDDVRRSVPGAVKGQLAALAGRRFQALLADHVKVHGEIYNRQALDLGGRAERCRPAEQLWAATHDRSATPGLLEQVFDAGRYEILCATGDWPPNLQGVWAGSWHTPWRGDYTQNGNVPAAVSNMLNGNMAELMLSYTGYLESLREHFRANARRQYGCRGLYLGARTSRHGYHLHYTDRWCHNFWTAGAAWAAGYFYDYYLFTGDRGFLLDHALPWMKQVAQFYEDFLIENEQGVYEFNPSYSPENTPAGSDSMACLNATMDIAAARQLLRNLIAACTELGIEQQGVARWRAMLAKMPPYLVNEDGALKEWAVPSLKDNYNHRHCSHFLPLWFGIDPQIAGDPALLAAARKAVRLRVEARRKGGGVMGFGLVQIGLAAASLGDSRSVWFCLDRLASRYYFPTFASAHNAGPRIFNADISGGLPSVMVEILVQSAPGRITLLGALPEQLPSGTITGVPCRGRVTVEQLRWWPDKVDFTLRSAVKQTVRVFCPGFTGGSGMPVALEAGRPCRVVLARAVPGARP